MPFNLHNCNITSTLSGNYCGSIAGGQPFYDNCCTVDQISINNNNIQVDLLGDYCGGLFGTWVLHQSYDNMHLQIKDNTILINNIDTTKLTAGICTHNFNSPYIFDNSLCSFSILNNNISSSVSVDSSTFGGIFYTVYNLPLKTPTGVGTLTITDNNLSGLLLTPIPEVDIVNNVFGPDFTAQIHYLFNDDGIGFYDNSVHNKIYATNIISGNIYGPINYPHTVDFSKYDYLLQWIYKNSLETLMEQTWFESYALYLRRAQVLR